MIGVYISYNKNIIEDKIKQCRDIFFISSIFIFYIISLIEKIAYDTYFIQTIDDYISTIPLAMTIFLLSIKKKNTNETILSKVGRQSLGVYLIHIAFIELTETILYKL